MLPKCENCHVLCVDLMILNRSLAVRLQTQKTDKQQKEIQDESIKILCDVAITLQLITKVKSGTDVQLVTEKWWRGERNLKLTTVEGGGGGKNDNSAIPPSICAKARKTQRQ